jgi:hypothetical protein
MYLKINIYIYYRMLITKYTPQLLGMVSQAQRDKDLELEVLIRNYQNNKITSEMFHNTIKRLKGTSNIVYNDEVEMLDIIINSENIRFSIIGNDNILNYCQTNDIKSVDDKNLDILKKTPVSKTDVNEYRIRFNLKRETVLNKSNKQVLDIIKKWNSLDKIFRYKKRISFITSDKNFQYDLTILKSSNKKMIKGDNTITKKRNIKDYMKKYVVSPEYVLDFDEWFNSLKPNDNVTMVGKMKEIPMLSKNIKKSNVFNNELEYEIELEYIGNKRKSSKTDKSVLLEILQKLMLILQSIQKSYYIISEFEKNDVISNYKSIIGDYKFNGPMNVTLEKKHVLERKYGDYNNIISIRKGYSVTDKADGERNLLIVIDNGKMYLLNRKNDVKYLGASCKELVGCIFDCEYILKDKTGSNINLLMIFDAYFYNGDDIRKRILNRSNEEKTDGKIEKSRYEYVFDAIDILDTKLVLDSNNTLVISNKKFYFGDDDIYDIEREHELDEKEAELAKILDTESNEYLDLKSEITELKSDSKIFEHCDKVYKKDYIYDIDGLIFTPRNLLVGEEPGKIKRNMFNGRWYRSFKWKPPEQNTIDFLVEIVKDPKDKETDEISWMNNNGEITPYKTLILKVGYDPKIHTKFNSCRVLNENLVFDSKYSNVPFKPTDPYIKDIHKAYIPLEDNMLYTLEDKNIIQNNMIVECIYDPNETTIFKWKPLRIRDNLNPNDFVTATNVWNCIHNPVTLDMITTGNTEKENDFGIYYNRIMKRGDRNSAPMYDLHSYIKKKLIKDNTFGSKNLLDMSVGKSGDLNHWIDAEVNMLVGIDISNDGLNNSNNGGCNRILNKMSEMDNSQIGENYMMVWGNTSKNILDGSCGNDDLNKYYLDVIYGNIEYETINNGKLRNFYNLGNTTETDGGFDIVSSQFSIHYYFKDASTINIFLNNVSKSLKKGGRFIGTCLNGDEVFNNLKGKDIISSTDEVTSWKITKKYNQPKFTPSEASLGMEIDVYNESIGITFSEYLVNMDYLSKMCKKYNLELVENSSFETIHSTISSSQSYGKIKDMTADHKKYSFMNNYFIYEKTV